MFKCYVHVLLVKFHFGYKILEGGERSSLGVKDIPGFPPPIPYEPQNDVANPTGKARGKEGLEKQTIWAMQTSD